MTWCHAGQGTRWDDGQGVWAWRWAAAICHSCGMAHEYAFGDVPAIYAFRQRAFPQLPGLWDRCQPGNAPDRFWYLLDTRLLRDARTVMAIGTLGA
jgi:hypothetical protein